MDYPSLSKGFLPDVVAVVKHANLEILQVSHECGQ